MFNLKKNMLYKKLFIFGVYFLCVLEKDILFLWFFKNFFFEYLMKDRRDVNGNIVVYFLVKFIVEDIKFK